MTPLSQRDAALLWHPFTQHQTTQAPISIVRAEGAYLYDENGKAYLDLISSWWTNLHGHSHPYLAKAIYEQAQKLEHVMFAKFTHEPAVLLCEKLHALLPTALCRFFYSDNGSTAIETALKMAYQYWHNQGTPLRKRFLSFEGGYHGDTFGAMSVGAESHYHDPFRSFFFETDFIPYPDTFEGDANIEEKEFQALSKLDTLLSEKGTQIAAFLMEPMIQGASGMRMARASFLQQVIDKVRAHGILVIFDEVMTGFGRTGPLFALEHVDRTPDFLCLSKGLTGGFLPLALTISTQKVFEAFLSDEKAKALLHGHTYTANPLGCAVALASLELLLSPECTEARKAIELTHKQGLQELLNHLPAIQMPRVLGTIAAFNYPTNETTKNHLLNKGLLIRPLGDCVYLLPPYCIEQSHLLESYKEILTIL